MRICMPLVVENGTGVSGESKPSENGTLDVPTDFPRKAEQPARRAWKELGVAGPPEAVRAAFEVLLRRYCGEADDTPFQELLKRQDGPRTSDLALEGGRL